MKKVTLFSLSLLLLAACSSDNEPQSGTNTTDPVEIKLNSGIESITRAGGAITNTLSNDLSISIARIDAASAPTTYPSYKALLATSVHNARINKTGNTVNFRNTNDDANKSLYYLTNGYNTKLIAWYPRGTFAAGDGTNAANVTYSISDGQTDVMLSAEVAGKKSSTINSINLSHLLTQIQVKAYAFDAAAVDKWGKLTAAVKIKNQSTTCTVALPGTQNSEIVFSGTQDTSLSNTFATATALPTSSESAIDCGYAMIAPITTSSVMTLEVTTESGGVVQVPLTAQTYARSQVYVVTLIFKTTTVSSTVAIDPWTSSDPISGDVN